MRYETVCVMKLLILHKKSRRLSKYCMIKLASFYEQLATGREPHPFANFMGRDSGSPHNQRCADYKWLVPANHYKFDKMIAYKWRNLGEF